MGLNNYVNFSFPLSNEYSFKKSMDNFMLYQENKIEEFKQEKNGFFSDF